MQIADVSVHRKWFWLLILGNSNVDGDFDGDVRGTPHQL